MGDFTLDILPPQNWQDFENMMKDLAQNYFESTTFNNYGRAGQDQQGVDITGYDSSNKFIGIQCKHKRQYNAKGIVDYTSLIDKKTIDAEIIQADTFDPKFDKYIIATSSLNSVDICDHINLINQNRIQSGKALVEIWFWENIKQLFNKHTDLLYTYYENFLRKENLYNKDIHILAFLKAAFSRTAFERVFHLENHFDDFLQALTDTKAAIQTGILKTRTKDLMRTSYPYTNISNQDWKKTTKEIYQRIEKLIKYYTEVIQKGEIEQRSSFIVIKSSNPRIISDNINMMRKEMLLMLNSILKEANIESIESELLK